jgi:O-antigen/teichoic acid export membrane protein
VRLLPFSLSATQKTVIGQTLIQLFGKGLTVLATLLIVSLLASTDGLGRSGYGAYTTVVVYVSLFYLAVDFGFNAVYVKYVQQHPQDEAAYFGHLLSLRLVASLMMALLALVVLVFLDYSLPVKFGVLAALVTIVLQGIATSCNGFFQSRQRYQLMVVSNVIASVTTVAVTYMLLWMGLGLTGALIGYICSFIVVAAMSLLLVSRYIPIGWRFEAAVWKTLFVTSIPLGLPILLNMVYFKSDSFILTTVHLHADLGLSREEAVALYGMAYRVFENLLVMPAFLMNAVYPIMLQAVEEGVDHLAGLMWKVLVASVAGSLLLAVIIWWLAPDIIAILSRHNSQFVPSIAALRWLMAGLPFFFASNVLVWTIVTLDHKRWLPLAYAVAGVFNVSLNVWLIPQYGFIAAAIITGLTELVILAILIPIAWSAFGSYRQRNSDDAVALMDGPIT